MHATFTTALDSLGRIRRAQIHGFRSVLAFFAVSKTVKLGRIRHAGVPLGTVPSSSVLKHHLPGGLH